jgi:neopullulanase
MKFRVVLFFIGIILISNIGCKKSNKSGSVESAKIEIPEEFKNAATPKRVEPLNWWVGMKEMDLEIMVHDPGIANSIPTLKYPGVKLTGFSKGDSPNYLFLNLKITPDAVPGFVPIIFKGARTLFLPYELKQRNPLSKKGQGVTAKDLVYLVFPDRFSNGDISNDNDSTLLQNKVYRDSLVARHGGDIKGISNHLDYIKDLGVTAIWINPLLESNQIWESYHGYAPTDLYKIDPRFGSNNSYVQLTDEIHKKGMKVILDVVLNHIGNNHWWMKDLPSKDWLNRQLDTFDQTSYRAVSKLDPYASESDLEKFGNGWFVRHMPDLNQKNPHVAKYLIQNVIWWIETASIDGLRVDTYTYSDTEFANTWVESILKEYPNISMVGEVWEQSPALQAGFAKSNIKTKLESKLPGLIDFQLQSAIIEALNREQGWTEGAAKIYYTLAQDYLYENPFNTLIFLDNHDVDRFFSMIGKGFRKYQTGVNFLMTTRGIPSFYYGTEILMAGNASPSHGNIRKDFPGGFPGDKMNKFEEKGRTTMENEALEHFKKIAKFRNNTSALQTGKLTQYVPSDNVYTYFRTDDKNNIMIIMNLGNQPRKTSLQRFAKNIRSAKSGINIMNGKTISDLSSIRLEPYESVIVDLK